MHNLQLYYRIEQGIQSERPELVEYLSMVSAVNFLRRPVSSVVHIVKYLITRYKFIYYMK